MTFQHRAGVSPHTSSYDLAETCVFGKQLLGPFICGLVSLPRLPLLRTYGVNLPSSLTTLLPLVLGFSPHPPVSVCGTGTFALDSGFSRQCEIVSFGTLISLLITPQKQEAYLTTSLSSVFKRTFPAVRSDYPSASPPLLASKCSTGISTCCPSATPFGLVLGPD